MPFWYNPRNTQVTRDTNTVKSELERAEKRMFDKKRGSLKRSLLNIARGFVAVFVMTGFEYAKQSPRATEILNIMFNVGFIVSAIAVLLLPLGFYQLLKYYLNK